MTEIPEHLLKRAAERRAAMGQGGDASAAPAADSGAAPAAADAPAAVTKAKAAPAPLPTLDEVAAKAKPDSPVVAAAKRRKRVPFWAAPILAILPVWGVIYLSSVQPPPAGDNDPLVIGAAVYTANCAGCHNPNGSGVKGGGTGQQLNEGEVLKTFKDPLGMAYWIHNGAAGGARTDGTYGDLDRPGGARNVSTLTNIMPAFPTLTSEEMAALVIYIRQEIAGGDPTDDPTFNAELFTKDPTVLEKLVEEVTALKANDPDSVSTVDGAEKSE